MESLSAKRAFEGEDWATVEKIDARYADAKFLWLDLGLFAGAACGQLQSGSPPNRISAGRSLVTPRNRRQAVRLRQ
jgi:hypothetical protein